MTTVNALLKMYKTQVASRQQINDFRMAYGDVDFLSEISVELVKTKSKTLDAERFMVFTCMEDIPVTLTTYRRVSNNWVANTAVNVVLCGVFSYPGKVSIYIENPSDNPSDLPYRFTAVYS